MGSCYSYFTPKNVNLNQTSKTIKYLYFLFQTFPPPFNNIPPKFSTFTLISHTSIISYALFLRFMITMLISNVLFYLVNITASDAFGLQRRAIHAKRTPRKLYQRRYVPSPPVGSKKTLVVTLMIYY